MRVVVIGASHAGVGFVDAMRRRGFSGELTLIERQTGLPMERPPLSKGFLFSQQNDESFGLRKPDWYGQNNVRLLDGCDVVGIDVVSHVVTLDDGRRLSYDRLVLATGAHPRCLPASDHLGGVFVLRDPDNARRLRDAASRASSVVVVGGGYIGLEVAASLTKASKRVTVIEAAPRLLARVASHPVSDFYLDLHRKEGVEVITGIGVSAIREVGGQFRGLDLEDGRQIDTDMLVVGIGVVPQMALAEGAGLETADGVLVDCGMQTSVDGIYAIGDGAMERDGRYGVRLESVHNAQETADLAAASILGQMLPKRQAPWFWSDQFGVKLQSAGVLPVVRDALSHVRREGRREDAFSVWSFDGSELVAVEAVGDPAGYMAGKTCLERGRTPTPEQVADRDFDLKAFVADKPVA